MAAGGGCVGPGCTRSVPVAVPVAAPVSARNRRVAAPVPVPVPVPAPQPQKTMTVMRRVRGRMVRVTIPVPAAPVPAVVAPVAVPADAGPDLTDSGLETVDPAIWGPPLWRFLHGAAAAAGTVTAGSVWSNVLEAMKTGLPCQECTDHYRAWFASHPIADGSVSAWLLVLHNDVNRRRGVPEWSAEQLAAAYPVAAAVAAAGSAAAVGLPDGLGPGLVAALRAL